MNAVVQHKDQIPAIPDEGTTILSIIGRAASDPSVDMEKMERLLSMYERVNAKTAEVSFNDAMSDAQAKMRPISADAVNPQTRSNYATYGKLDKALRPIYTDLGFALSFDTGEGPQDFVRVLCYVSHKAGHTRTYKVDMPADGKGAKGGDVMTKTHAVGAGMSYGMRYLLKMIFNVAVGEDDQDGNQVVSQQDQRKEAHDEALGIHQESVDFIKDRIAADDMQAVADEWRAIPRADQIALWLAPTKGGIFTTEERKKIKENLSPVSA